MKKWISFFLSVLLIFSCVAVLPASAQDTAVLEIGTVTGPGGGRLRVPVTLKNAGALKALGNGNVCGIEFNLSYDQSKAALIGVESGLPAVDAQGRAGAGWTVDSREYAGKNRAKIMLSDPYNNGFTAAGDVEVAVLVFQLADTGEEDVTVALTPEIVDICDNAPHKLNDRVEAAAGSLTIAQKQYAVLSAASVTAFPEQLVSVFLTLNRAQALSADCSGPAAGNGTICGLEMDLHYDTDLVTQCFAATERVSPTTNGSDGYWYAGVQQQPDGRIKLLVVDPELVGAAAVDEVVLCVLSFRVAKNVPPGTEISVGLTLVDICDSKGKSLSDFVRTESFTIRVEEEIVSDAVTAVISEIQRVSKVTLLGERQYVESARRAYNRLSEEEKAQVTNYADLLAAEAKISELEIAEAKRLIYAIGEVTFERADAIREARTFYDALSIAQQEQLTAEYAILTAAEQQLALLQPKLGDLDWDGKVTVSDVVELRKVIVSGVWDATVFYCGNLDGDGTLSVSDVVELRKRIVAG